MEHSNLNPITARARVAGRTPWFFSLGSSLLIPFLLFTIGCGVPPKPGELLTTESIRAQSAVEELQTYSPDYWREHERFYRLSVDSWQGRKLTDAKEYAEISTLMLKSAEAEVRKAKAQEALKNAEIRLRTITKTRDEQQRTLQSISSDIDQIQQKIRMAKEMEAVRDQMQASRADALERGQEELQERLARILEKMQEAESINAVEHAPQLHKMAQNAINQAKERLDQNLPSPATAAMNMAEKALDEAIAQARPLYEAHQAQLALEAAAAQIMDQASGVGGAEVRREPRGVVIVAYDVFETRRNALTQLKPDQVFMLERIAQVLSEHPQFPITIEGHTDNRIVRGEQAKKTSMDQAMVVRNLFNRHGVEVDRMQTTSYGEDAPVTDNNSVAGRQKNRRVEIVLHTR